MPTATDGKLKEGLLGLARPQGWGALRAAAEAALVEQTLPSTRMEDWKYLDLSPLAGLSFAPGQPAEVDIRERILPEARGTRLVFVNGRHDPHHSCASALPAGVRMLHLASASEGAPQLGTLLEPGAADFFTALNTARFTDGAYLFVPRGVKVEAPLHLLFLSHQEGAQATFTQPRILVVLERGAELELIEEHAGTGRYLTNAAVEILVAEGATLRHERVQRESAEAFHFASLRAKVGRDARYFSRTITLGARLSRQAPQVELDENAEISLDGLALLNGEQVADTHSLIHHAKPHGTSRQLHKCIVDDSAKAIFNGQVLVAQGAQVTDAQQQSRNLLLSEKATVDTKPQLEIYADDVKCAHGAAVGALDPEELFYLQSRGLNAQAARNLLTYGFASDLLGHIEVASLRRQLRQQVMARTNAADLVGAGLVEQA
ncbi:MAG TPA: Fe-S cluster assembly protein SufD [Holophagaceae bacterium]|nr:Fe-S cluster assembly protein SufD [Holophagaceae bacterium]